MWGIGKKRPSGSPDEPERALFRELGDKQDQGGRRSRRRMWLVLTTVAAVGVLAGAVPLVANAVLGTDGPTLFELDGNIVDNSGAPNLPQDLSDFQQPPAVTGMGPVAKTFITDGFNGTNDTIFKGGGSQNNNDIPSWAWDCGSVSTKSDIEYAFAAAYLKKQQPRTSTSARTATTRRAALPTSASGSSGWRRAHGRHRLPWTSTRQRTGSPAAHVNGDIFVFAEFAGGGGDSAISIYEWKNGALSLLFVKTAANFCNPADTICGKTEHRPDRRSMDVLRQPGDGGREDHDRRLLRGRHQPVCSVPGARQGHPLRQPVPRRHGQLPPGYRRSRGLRRWQLQPLFEAHRRQGHLSLRRPDEIPLLDHRAKRVQPVTSDRRRRYALRQWPGQGGSVHGHQTRRRRGS